MVLWLLFRPPFLATGRAASSGRGPSAWAQIHGSFTKRTQGDVRRRSFSHRTQRESAAMMLTHTPYGDHPLVTRRGSRVISVLIVTPFYNEYRVTCRLNCSILFLFLYCGLWLWSLQRAQCYVGWLYVKSCPAGCEMARLHVKLFPEGGEMVRLHVIPFIKADETVRLYVISFLKADEMVRLHFVSPLTQLFPV